MEDITPELLDKIQKEFDQLMKGDKTINEVMVKIADGTANYHDANTFALSLGDILSKAYGDNLSSDVLPDGKMYYNIAKRIIEPTMKNNYDLISDATADIQTLLNANANIGIKAIKPELNQDRIDGIINRVSSADHFDNISWILQDPIQTYSQSIVDDSIKTNAEFHSKSGMKPKIVRRLAGNCCDWCRSLAGSYSYPDVPKDVYRRHNNCRCTVEYHPGDGKVQDVHTKQWLDRDKINERIAFSEKDSSISDVRKELLKHNIEYKNVDMLSKNLNEDEIVSKIAGGDMTKGSCSSLAFSYIGNKAGLDVIDFRGGNSQHIFSLNSTIQSISKLDGISSSIIKVKREINDTMKIIQNLEKGKEYYLAVGRHAAIIRNTEKGSEYLELQSSVKNGWKSFDEYGTMSNTLYRRFGCRKSVDRIKIGDMSMVFERPVVLMDVDSFKENEEFRKILGYINTSPDKQKKGVTGNVK